VNKTTLVIGGCRSGKSRHALELADQLAGNGKRVFVATCVPHDAEMQERVRRHKAERGPEWSALEIPTALPSAIRDHGPGTDVMLIDCLTLWVSNLLFESDDPAFLEQSTADLTRALNEAPCPVICVSNEVGAGIVPENGLARLFRDTAGMVNQRVAAAVDKVVWMVAGIPVIVKGKD